MQIQTVKFASLFSPVATALVIFALATSAASAEAATIIDFGSGGEGFLPSWSYTDPTSGTVVSTTPSSSLALDYGAATALRPRTSPGNVLTRGIVSPGDSIGASSPFPLDVLPGVETRTFAFDFITADVAISVTATGYDGAGNVLATATSSYSAPSYQWRDYTGPTITSNQPFARIEIRSSGNIGMAFDNLSFDAVGVPEPATSAMGGMGVCGLLATRRRREALRCR